jgi:hypothetical protein
MRTNHPALRAALLPAAAGLSCGADGLCVHHVGKSDPIPE